MIESEVYIEINKVKWLLDILTHMLYVATISLLLLLMSYAHDFAQHLVVLAPFYLSAT